MMIRMPSFRNFSSCFLAPGTVAFDVFRVSERHYYVHIDESTEKILRVYETHDDLKLTRMLQVNGNTIDSVFGEPTLQCLARYQCHRA